MRDYTKDDASSPFFSSKWLLNHFDVLEPDELKENDLYFSDQAKKDGDQQDADDSTDGFSFS
jgi:hypothetical protein